jgi:hypothetical protein
VPAEAGEYLGLCPALAQLARTDRSRAAPELQTDIVTMSDSGPWERTHAEPPIGADRYAQREFALTRGWNVLFVRHRRSVARP